MTVDDWKDLLPKKSSIIIWGIIGLVCLTLQGCYTQLSMFHPDEKTEEFYPYSVARVRPNLSLYANDGAGQSLGMAYQMMYNRFTGFMGFGNRYNYYNPYYYGGYYREYYNIGGYTLYIPITTTKEKTVRTFTTRYDNSINSSPTTNLRITRSSSSNTISSSTSSSTNSSSRIKVTRRN